MITISVIREKGLNLYLKLSNIFIHIGEIFSETIVEVSSAIQRLHRMFGPPGDYAIATGQLFRWKKIKNIFGRS